MAFGMEETCTPPGGLVSPFGKEYIMLMLSNLLKRLTTHREFFGRHPQFSGHLVDSDD